MNCLQTQITVVHLDDWTVLAGLGRLPGIHQTPALAGPDGAVMPWFQRSMTDVPDNKIKTKHITL